MEKQSISKGTNHGSHFIAKPDGNLCSNCIVALWVLLIKMIVIVRSRCWSAAPPLLSQDRHQPEIAPSPSGNSATIQQQRKLVLCQALLCYCYVPTVQHSASFAYLPLMLPTKSSLRGVTLHTYNDFQLSKYKLRNNGTQQLFCN